MTISPLLVYFWGQADKLSDVLQWMAGIPLFIGIVGSIVSRLVPDTEFPSIERARSIRKMFLIPLIMGCCAWIAYAVLPSSKTVATMVILPVIVNSEPIQKDLPEIYDLAIKALKEQIGAKND